MFLHSLNAIIRDYYDPEHVRLVVNGDSVESLAETSMEGV
jgi:intracellular sulfur oxidation DsrE/DsrF family protein